jgi:2-aminoadipate transaminase
MSDSEDLLSTVGRLLQPNAIRKLTKLIGRSDVIALGAGAPSWETFPIDELADIAGRVIKEQGQSALQYGPTRGNNLLVNSVVEILGKREIESTPAEVVMTTGSQQGLDLVARILFDPGDVALVELPSYIGGIIAIHNAQAKMVGVRQDEEGIDIADLRAKIEHTRAEGRRVKCLYTITNFQNPSGVSLSADRRESLIEVADEYNLLIIEDDPYFDLYFGPDGSRPKPLAALRPSRTIYLSSFSKVLSPGLRTAYLRAPEELSYKIELAKEGADLSSSVLDQAIVAEAVRLRLVDRRLAEIRNFYHIRCRAMLDALEEFAPDDSSWTKPLGGFFIFMKVPERFDTAELLPMAIERGVAYVPGSPFFVDGTGSNTLRLAFSKETPERIVNGIRELSRILA